MFLNFKFSILSLFIISGFLIFISNSYKINFDKNKLNIIIEDKSGETLENKKGDLHNIKEKNIPSETSIINTTSEYKQTKLRVKKGQTFLEILENLYLKNEKKFQIINAINKKFKLRNLNVNQEIIFFFEEKNKLKKIIIVLDFNKNLVVNLDSKINVEIVELETYVEVNSKEYLIKSSLYADGIKNEIPNEILIKLIQLFSFDLDFQRDIKKDTQVSLSFQEIYVENKLESSYGDIEYAKISINKNTLEYFKFITDDGFTDYFNKDGKNVKKSILKTPLDGAKLSSNFGMRKHPISGYNKMHKGIDFAAPKGTPVYAGGNGVIEIAGRNGGYGKYIRIRHNNEYKTAYAHLSGFKKGIKKGVRVNQGDVIGYVGSTGKSTGPHLHYEIIYKNKQINPLKLKLPSGKILKGDEFKRFESNYKIILANHLNNLFE